MMSYADDLQCAMLEAGYSQYSLAKASGVPQPTIRRILIGESKEPKQSTIAALEKILGKPIGPKASGYDNVGPAPAQKGFIPLISWVRAGSFAESPDTLHPGDAEEWLSSHSHHGDNSYALRVEGDSMVSDNPGAMSFPPGCIILIDPDRPVLNGSKVIAKHIESNAVTFKVFIEDGESRYLKPLNRQYPLLSIDHQYQIIGVVFEKIERL